MRVEGVGGKGGWGWVVLGRCDDGVGKRRRRRELGGGGGAGQRASAPASATTDPRPPTANQKHSSPFFAIHSSLQCPASPTYRARPSPRVGKRYGEPSARFVLRFVAEGLERALLLLLEMRATTRPARQVIVSTTTSPGANCESARAAKSESPARFVFCERPGTVFDCASSSTTYCERCWPSLQSQSNTTTSQHNRHRSNAFCLSAFLGRRAQSVRRAAVSAAGTTSRVVGERRSMEIKRRAGLREKRFSAAPISGVCMQRKGGLEIGQRLQQAAREQTPDAGRRLLLLSRRSFRCVGTGLCRGRARGKGGSEAGADTGSRAAPPQG